MLNRISHRQDRCFRNKRRYESSGSGCYLIPQERFTNGIIAKRNKLAWTSAKFLDKALKIGQASSTPTPNFDPVLALYGYTDNKDNKDVFRTLYRLLTKRLFLEQSASKALMPKKLNEGAYRM